MRDFHYIYQYKKNVLLTVANLSLFNMLLEVLTKFDTQLRVHVFCPLN